MKRIKEYRNYIVLFVFVVAAFIAYKIIDNVPAMATALSTLVGILSPFLTGFVIAFVLSIPMNRIEKLLKKSKKAFLIHHTRGVSVAIVYVLLIALVGGTLAFVIPPLARSLIDLIGKLPAYYAQAVAWVDSLTVDGKIAGFTLALPEEFSVASLLSGVDLSALSTYAQGVFAFGSGIVSLFLSLIVSIYMLLSKESLIGSVKRLVRVVTPKRAAAVLIKYTDLISDTFYKYIYSQLVDALIVGLACVIGFLIAGVPYAALLGIAVGLANLIPYFGAIISGVCVVLICLLSGNPVQAIIVAVLIVVIQQVDCNLIQPKIIGVNVGIKPLYVLLAITVGGGLFGVPGMVLGVPVIAVLKTMLSDFIRFREEKMSICAADPPEDPAAEAADGPSDPAGTAEDR
ncbi:MAG: AI-2E family transporter [Candidatus Howiella sp.]|jgi:predicted PurR-regulated permease PerM